jgi:hypothetical protein
VENFEVIFGPGGSSPNGWSIHRLGRARAIDPRKVSGLSAPIKVEYRQAGKLITQGWLDPRPRWWTVLDEALVFFQGRLLPFSIALARSVEVPVPENHSEQVPDGLQPGFDWLPQTTNNRITFKVHVSPADRTKPMDFDFQIDLQRLTAPELEHLAEFLQRQQSKTLTHYAFVRGIDWLLNVMLQQEQPALSKSARNQKIWELLGVKSPPSLKEHYFDLIGRTYLRRSGDEAQFEESKRRPYFREIYQSWRRAIQNYNPGIPSIPKNIKPTFAEKEELEMLFIALVHEKDPAQVYTRYLPLIERYAGDKKFDGWLFRALARRKNPDLTRLSLKYHLLCGWVHCFMWGYSNEDRVQILIHICGMPREKLNPQIVKKTASRSGLKGYSNFPKAYPVAPFQFRGWRDDRPMPEQ